MPLTLPPVMLRVGSWLYGKKPATASTQSLDSLTELRDRKYCLCSHLKSTKTMC